MSTTKEKLLRLLPFVFLVFGLTATLYSWNYIRNLNRHKTQESLDRFAEDIKETIINRLETYEDVHLAGGALFNAFGSVSKNQWKQWVTANHVISKYPGIKGLGICDVLPATDTAAYVSRIRKEIPSFRIRSLNSMEHDTLFLIRYLEPFAENQGALGFNMGSETIRRNALDSARSSGHTFMTSRIQLIQDTMNRAGFLMYVPIYKNTDTNTVSDRLKNFRCYVYSPFIVEDFINPLVKTELAHISSFFSFQLSVLKDDRVKEELYSFQGDAKAELDLQSKDEFRIYGEEWVLDVQPTIRFQNTFANKQAITVLIGGIVVTSLLSLLLASLIGTRKRAILIADEITGELKSLNIFYDNLLQSMNDAFVVVTPDLRIMKVNRRFLDYFHDNETSNLYNPISETALYEIAGELQGVVQSGVEKEKVFRLYNNRYYSVVFTPIKRENGKLDSVLIVLTDITDKIENEQRKNDFIGFATHELRTPLTNLKAYTQLGEKLYREGKIIESCEFYRKVNGFIEDLIKLVNELHDVTKYSSGKLVGEKQHVDISMLVSEVVDSYRVSYPHHHFHLEVERDMHVHADKQRLIQVISNYISNAVKYAPDSKEVVIKCEGTGSDVVVMVKDFGPGIPEESKPKLFDRFYRIKKYAKMEGLGLGLFLCKEIIEAHGGKVWVNSTEGNGAEFYFSLPGYMKEKLAA